MLTIDTSVWVAAADRRDLFYAASREFLREVMRQRQRIFIPAFARLEIACALARRTHNPVTGQILADALLDTGIVVEVPLDGPLLAHSIRTGTRALLRGADALYAVVAARYRTRLISWDEELNRRASGITPSDWPSM